MGCGTSSAALAAVNRPKSIYVKRDDVNEYDGEYLDGMMHGYGKIKYHNGDLYIGNCNKNRFQGLGLYRFANGELYEGEYNEGKRHGLGKYTYPDGESYEGPYVDDMMSGIGVYNYSNGDKYEGEFLLNRPNGRGKLTKINEIFDGNFIDGNYVNTTRKEDDLTLNSVGADAPGVAQQGANSI